MRVLGRTPGEWLGFAGFMIAVLLIAWGLSRGLWALRLAVAFLIVFAAVAWDKWSGLHIKHRDKIQEIEEMLATESKRRKRELVIELKCRSIMEHPKCAAYYAPFLERAMQGEDVVGEGRPFINHDSFRLVYQGDDLIWSDFHNSFLEKFELRGHILNVDWPDSPSKEPQVWLRFEGSELQLFLVVKDPENPLRRDTTPLSAFPASSLMYAFESYEDTPKRLKALVGDLKERGFKWYTWGPPDPHENELGEMQLFEPDEGYVAFSDQWVCIKYKERDLWPSVNSYGGALKELG